ncbi:hypothetical protein CDAR_78371 [Caerostris darwini]|uniref:Uncharacterized protein n=1 Tax=Caerostris darwini TaxID=1538125 RepID=A0AAV4SFK1_9ARAC|nr:hypothetical protein CDAR_78371 [Caerostris darwini]
MRPARAEKEKNESYNLGPVSACSIPRLDHALFREGNPPTPPPPPTFPLRNPNDDRVVSAGLSERQIRNLFSDAAIEKVVGLV